MAFSFLKYSDAHYENAQNIHAKPLPLLRNAEHWFLVFLSLLGRGIPPDWCHWFTVCFWFMFKFTPKCLITVSFVRPFLAELSITSNKMHQNFFIMYQKPFSVTLLKTSSLFFRETFCECMFILFNCLVIVWLWAAFEIFWVPLDFHLLSKCPRLLVIVQYWRARDSEFF